MQAPADALVLDGIRQDYPGRPGVLDGIRLRIPGGQLAVLQGRSGSGKSTLLAIAAGLEPPAAGTVLVAGQAMDARDVEASSALRARTIGLVLQHLHLLSELDVAENVELPLRLAGVPRAEARERATALLRRFGMADRARQPTHTLSGGEQQRVAIARALALDPALLLVDEPTSSLDDANARQVIAALQEAAAGGAAVLVASHDPLLQGLGRTLRLQDGRLQERVPERGQERAGERAGGGAPPGPGASTPRDPEAR